MKNRFIFVLFTILTLLFSGLVVEAEEKTSTYAITAPKIDGKIDEVWDSAEKWYVSIGPENGTTTGYFSVLWAEGGLFVIVNVEDTTLFPGDEVDDGGLVYVAEIPTSANTYSGDSEYRVTGYTNGWFGGIATDNKSIHKAREILSDSNYVLEFFIPTQTSGLSYSDGYTIGLALAIFDDIDGDNVKDDIYGTAEGNFMENPSLLQQVRLEKPEGVGMTKVPTDIDKNVKIAVGIMIFVMIVVAVASIKAKKVCKNTNMYRMLYVAMLGTIGALGIIRGYDGTAEFLKYFTYLSNVLVLGMSIWQMILILKQMSGKCKKKDCAKVPSAIKGWIVMCIAFTFLTSLFVLNTFKLPNDIQDAIIHYIVPIFSVIEFWVYEERGGIKKHYPLCWSLTPLVYYVYVWILYLMGVKFNNSNFPYYFMDYLTYGWGMVLGILSALYVIFIVFGYLLWLVDGYLNKRK